jgi:hypothetical protein
MIFHVGNSVFLSLTFFFSLFRFLSFSCSLFLPLFSYSFFFSLFRCLSFSCSLFLPLFSYSFFLSLSLFLYSFSLQQISGDVQLNVPRLTIVDPESVIHDYEVVRVLEVALEDWSKLIVNVVEAETPKVSGRQGHLNLNPNPNPNPNPHPNPNPNPDITGTRRSVGGDRLLESPKCHPERAIW